MPSAFVSPLIVTRSTSLSVGTSAPSFVSPTHQFCLPHHQRRIHHLPKATVSPPKQDQTPASISPSPSPSAAVNNPSQSSTSKSPSVSSLSSSPFPQNAIPYFAFFSNLNPRKIGPTSVLTARRFSILQTEKATASSHRLSFDAPGIPPFEPVMANITSDPSSTVHGLVHWVSPSDFTLLSRSELALDSPFSPTRVIEVNVEIEMGSIVHKVTAKTFLFPRVPKFIIDVQRIRPSRRYVEVAIEGAKYWNLDESYIENVLKKIEYEKRGPYSLYTEPRPHILDRPNPTEIFGRPSSEVYSPFRMIRAKEAVKQFEQTQDEQNSSSLQLVQLSRNQQRGGDVVNDNCSGSTKKGLYFIPGIDGQGKSILSQVHDVEQDGVYDMKSFVIPFENRETLSMLSSQMLQMIADDNNAKHSEQPVTIIAESMGGALALLLALENVRRHSSSDDGDTKTNPKLDIELMMLMNPATCYSRSAPKALWEFLFSLQLSENIYNVLLPAVLLPFLLDFGSTITGVSPEIVPRLVSMLGVLTKLSSEVLPKDSTEHRMKLLTNLNVKDEDLVVLGNDGAIGRPRRIAVLCSMNDNLIPSYKESYRLKRAIPGLYTAILPFGGHGMFFSSKFQLASFLRPFITLSERDRIPPPESNMETKLVNTRTSRRREALRNRYKMTEDEKQKEKLLTREQIGRLKYFIQPSTDIYSPVFIGEENIPSPVPNKPILFVCNHTLLGWLDGLFPLSRILQTKRVLLRSMVHPVLTRSPLGFPGLNNEMVTTDVMREFGILETSPSSLFQTLSRGEWVLLFPGGANEALKQSESDKYSVRWPEEPEFVRACALFGATIIPISTVGSEESVRVLLNSDEFMGIIENATNVTNRLGITTDSDLESLLTDDARKWKGGVDADGSKVMKPPLIAPTGREDRIYIRFGKPVDIAEECVEDKVQAKKVYEGIQNEVIYGVKCLLQRRQKDEFRGKERRQRFREEFGGNVQPPAGIAFSWMHGEEDAYLDIDLQPPL